MANVARPLLKNIINNDYYRIPNGSVCPFEPMQIHLDINEMIIAMLNKGYDIKVVAITINDSPAIPMRMNLTESDNVFNDEKIIKCDVKRRFEALQQRHRQKAEMMRLTQNVRLYNIYKEDGINYDVFIQNMQKYPDQLFGIKDEQSYVQKGGYWIVKYNRYYYLIMETNGLQHAQDIPQERYLMFRKLTLDQLKKYDNGSYWNLITKYNIQI